jgi:hypothetical protein
LLSERIGQDAWLSCTLSALKAVEESRYDDARSFWRDAYASADRLPSEDPRRAAALNNLGLSQFLAGHHQHAFATLSAARDQWRIVEAWVQQIDIPFTAGSSMFHFLLAANHPDAVAKLRRKKYLTLCAGAAAITDAVYDHVSEITPEPDRAQKHIQAIQAAFGEDAAEARSLAAFASLPSPAKQAPKIQSVEERWRSVSRNTVVEMRPLVDAAYLTVGLRPEYFKRTQPQPG